MATKKAKAKAKPKASGMKGNAKINKVMHEWKTGTLHSGKGGPVVKNRKQAIAIAMSEQARANVKKKGSGRGK